MKVVWRAKLMRHWFRVFSFHGEFEMEDTTNERLILRRVRQAVLKALSIEYEV